MRKLAIVSVSFAVAANAFAYTVKGPENPKPWEATAVQELTDYLARRVVGKAKVTVEGRPVVAFHVGDTAFAARKGLSSKTMEEECWTIRSFGGDVVLNGGGYRGCLYAVYHFLEDYCGVRWWSEKEEDVLHSGNLALPKLNVTDRPALFLRCIVRSNNPKVATSLLAVRRRLNCNSEVPIPLSLGGAESIGPPAISHTFGMYVPFEKYGKEHPEYFAVHKKKPGDEDKFQLCLSNPDVRRLLLEGVMSSVEKSAAEAKAKGLLPPRNFALSKNDNEYFCECPRCAAETKKYGQSGYHLKVINPIAEEVARKHPGVRVFTSAYLYTQAPPKGGARAASNVAVSFCPLGVNFASSIMTPGAGNDEARKNLIDWKDSTDNVLVWDYAITFGRDTLGYPIPNEWYFGEKYRFYASCNVRGIMWEQEWPHLSDIFDLKFYFLSKLSEKPDLDYPALMKRTYSEFFGPKAGPFVYASRERLHEIQKQRRPEIGFMPALPRFDFITEEDAAFMADMYDRAEKAVAGDARYIRRLKRARSGLDRLMERRRTLFKRDSLDGKPCWMTELSAFGTPHSLNAYMVNDASAPLGKAMELAKKAGHVSPLQVICDNGITKKGQLKKQLEIPATTKEYAWFDLGRVTLEKGTRFLMTKSYLGQFYTPQSGEVLGKTFDVKILAKTTDKGQIRIGRMAFVDVEDRQVEKK